MIGNIQSNHGKSYSSYQRAASSSYDQTSMPARNRKGLSSIKVEELRKLLSLPDNLIVGTAVDEGGCFFDALSQVLNSSQSETQYTEKHLRLLCHNYFYANENNKKEVSEWNNNDYGGVDKGDDYAFVQYTKKELDTDFYERAPIWGRQNVEGVILCRALNIPEILVIEILVDPEKGQHIIAGSLITADGVKAIEEELSLSYLGNMPTLVVGQKDLHFVPILPINYQTNLSECAVQESKINKLDYANHTSNNTSEKDLRNEHFLLPTNDFFPKATTQYIEDDIDSLTRTLSKMHIEDRSTIEYLINKIHDLRTQFNKERQSSKPNLDALKKELDEIYDCFAHPSRILRSSYHGGLNEIKEKYWPILLQVNLYLQQSLLLTQSQAEKIDSAFSLGAQIYKMNSAYAELCRGKKFEKSGFNQLRNNELQVNPVRARSKMNIQQLIHDLKTTGLHCESYCGLRKDEVELFSLLLNLPYKLQHATNHFYPALNAGSLDSYTELTRHNPDYKSPFSTKGNIDKLENGGFVFFRLYVDPINNEQTRYGDTSLVLDLTLLRRCGWISLHDQLNPFPSKSPNTRHFYYGQRLLRTSEATPLPGQSKSDKSLWGGLKYNYRSSSISSYTGGKKDTLKSFGQDILVSQREANFVSEMFYGEDILLGIALSVIRELRCLEACGFRTYFLNRLYRSNSTEKQSMLGTLIKDLFRIEGKYPVAVRLRMDVTNKTQFFKPIAQSDTFIVEDRSFTVLNPDGDGRYNIDMSINGHAMKQAILKEELKAAEEKFSMARQQRARTKPGSEQFQKWDTDVRNYSDLILKIESQLDVSREKRQDIIDYFLNTFEGEVQAEEFIKIDTYKLELIYENYRELLEDDISYLDTLLALNTLQLRLISEEPFCELIDDFSVFEELAECSSEQLEILSNYDIAVALNEKGESVRELIRLYEENPMHLTCLTCDDLFELVLDIAPDVDSVVLDYAMEEGVDLEEIADQLGESDAMLFRLNAGLYDEYESEVETNDNSEIEYSYDEEQL